MQIRSDTKHLKSQKFQMQLIGQKRGGASCPVLSALTHTDTPEKNK